MEDIWSETSKVIPHLGDAHDCKGQMEQGKGVWRRRVFTDIKRIIELENLFFEKTTYWL